MSKTDNEYFVDEVYKKAREIIRLEHITGASDTNFATIIEVEGQLTEITIKTRNVTSAQADAIEKGFEAAQEVMNKTKPENVTKVVDVDDNDKIIHEKGDR